MDKRDRLLELTEGSARRGLGALSSFLCCPLRDASRAQEWEPAQLRRLGGSGGQGAVGLFADLDGAVGGRLGVILDRELACALVRPLVRGDVPGRDWRECSALLEASNVAFSAAAGALGDAIGVVVFPSIPRIWLQSEAGFEDDLACDDLDGLGAYAVFARAESQGTVGEVCLIWLPTLPE